MTSESKSRVLYDNLDTTFVNLWALLRKLSGRGFIGRVHVELKDYTADVFMTGSNTPLVHEIDRVAGTDTLEEAALHRLVLRVRETPGTISVFEGPDEAVSVQSTASQQFNSVALDPISSSGAGDLAVHYEPEEQTETEPPAGDEPTLTPAFESPPPPSLPESEPHAPVAERNFAVAPAQSVDAAEPIDEIEWGAIVKVGGELVAGIERAVSGAGADFAPLFNAARLGLADDYVFLDPLSGQLSYANSVLTLTGVVPASSFVSGLSEALHRVVDRVASGDRARRVRERAALELFSVARKRNEILARSGFLSQLDRIAGTKVI